MNKSFRIVLIVACSCFIATSLWAKSVYVIANRYGVPTFPVLSYDIQPDSTMYQEQLPIPNHGLGASCITADEDNEILFVTFKNDPIIELIDAKLLTSVGYDSLDGITNPAGSVFSQDKGYLLALQRNTNHLYVFDWDSNTKTSEPLYNNPYYVELAGIVSGMDLTLDNEYGILYVADSSQFEVHSYYLDSWLDAGCTTTQEKSTHLTLDENNGYLYTVNEQYGSKIIQYDMSSGISNSYTIDANAQVMDLAVNTSNGFIYITLNYTSGLNSMIVINNDLELIATLDENVAYPSGVYVPSKDIGYNPFDLKIDDGVFTWIAPNSIIHYTISFRNLLNYPLEYIHIKDWLPSVEEVSFYNVSTNGIYDQEENTITWDIGTLEHGGVEQEVWVELKVLSGIQNLSTLINYFTIGNDIVATTKYIHTRVKSSTPIIQSFFEPNPYNPEINQQAGIAHLNFEHGDSPISEVKIYDSSNEVVLERRNLGTNAVTWDGKNESGEFVSNSVYFMIVKNSAGEKAIIKIAILR